MISSLCWNVLLLKAISARSSLCSGLSSRLRASCVIGRLPLYRLLCQEHCFLVFLNKPDCHSEQDSSCCLWAALPALLQQRRQLPRKGPGSLRWNQLRCPEGSQASLWAPAGSHTYPTHTPCPGTAACLAVNQLHSNFYRGTCWNLHFLLSCWSCTTAIPDWFWKLHSLLPGELWLLEE